MEEHDALRNQIAALEKELAEQKQKNESLERVKGGGASDNAELPGAISEFEETLRRLVQRTAMIVQAEKMRYHGARPGSPMNWWPAPPRSA